MLSLFRFLCDASSPAYFSTGGASPTFATTKADANLSWQYDGATGTITKGAGCSA